MESLDITPPDQVSNIQWFHLSQILHTGQGFQPCFEAGIRELPFLMPEPAEKPSLQIPISLYTYAWWQPIHNKVVCLKARMAINGLEWMVWRDIVGWASWTGSCSTQDYECPVTVKTYY